MPGIDGDRPRCQLRGLPAVALPSRRQPALLVGRGEGVEGLDPQRIERGGLAQLGDRIVPTTVAEMVHSPLAMCPGGRIGGGDIIIAHPELARHLLHILQPDLPATLGAQRAQPLDVSPQHLLLMIPVHAPSARQ